MECVIFYLLRYGGVFAQFPIYNLTKISLNIRSNHNSSQYFNSVFRFSTVARERNGSISLSRNVNNNDSEHVTAHDAFTLLPSVEKAPRVVFVCLCMCLMAVRHELRPAHSLFIWMCAHSFLFMKTRKWFYGVENNEIGLNSIKRYIIYRLFLAATLCRSSLSLRLCLCVCVFNVRTILFNHLKFFSRLSLSSLAVMCKCMCNHFKMVFVQ